MAVRVIRATQSQTTEAAEPAVLRVAAYCRVSTDSDEQETSYDAQVTHYTNYICDHPGWTLAGIYAEEEPSYPALFCAYIYMSTITKMTVHF